MTHLKVGDKVIETWADPVGNIIQSEGEVLEVKDGLCKVTTRYGYDVWLKADQLEAAE